MFDRNKLSVAELKSIITQRRQTMSAGDEELMRRISVALGEPPAQAEPFQKEMLAMGQELMTELLAERLLSEERREPLITIQETTSKLRPALHQLLEARGLGSDDVVTHQIAERMMESAFTAVTEAISSRSTQEQTSFDRHWKPLQQVLDLAEERGVAPTDVLQTPGAGDELVRRSQTREQFIASSTERWCQTANAETMFGLFSRTLLAAHTWDSEEDRQEAEGELRKECMPILERRAALVRPVFDAWIADEATRIYGSA